MNTFDYRRFFLIALIAALSISAIIGIFIFLAGDFGETESKLLLTTLSVGGFSLTGLCSSSIQDRARLKGLAVAGMMTSVIGFVVTAGTIWELLDAENSWKAVTTLIVVSVALGHSSLLLQIEPNTNSVRYALIGTVVVISIVALLLIKAIFNEFDETEFYFRLLGVFAILDVLGTIATPILNKI